MNLDTAVKTHAQWKTKFRGAIANKEKLDALSISRDNCCDLGKWLHGPARTEYSSVSEYTATVQAHKKFHVLAGNVAELINKGEFKEAEQALSNGTPYSDASMDVSVAINRLKKVLG